MRTRIVTRDMVDIHSRLDGVDDPAAPTVVFANSLGTDLTLWDPVIPHLPEGLRLIRYDKRGHGLSSVPPAPYSMGALVSDAEAVCDAWEVRDCIFVGLSVGGLIAQGLAVKRLDIVRGIVLSNTAAKIGTKDRWEERIAAVREGGLSAIADDILDRWFGPAFLASPQLHPWRALLLATPPEGYMGVCAAIAGTDFFSTTASLRLPALAIAGSDDKATPPDLVRETANLIPGSRFELIRKAGHLPCVEQPAICSDLLSGFMRDIGHI